jgi:hypothetical protein
MAIFLFLNVVEIQWKNICPCAAREKNDKYEHGKKVHIFFTLLFVWPHKNCIDDAYVSFIPTFALILRLQHSAESQTRK